MSRLRSLPMPERHIYVYEDSILQREEIGSTSYVWEKL